MFYRKIFNNFFYSLKVFFYSLANWDTKYPNYLLKFEERVSKYFKSKYCLTFSNGTTAATSLFYACGIKENSLVLISKLSFPSIISLLLNLRCKIVYLDVDKNLQVILPEDDVLDKADFIILTHAYGFPQNINTINKLNFKNIKIIEDFSHSQGAKIEDKFTGTIGLGGFSSMQGEKAISSGEGGIVLTNFDNINRKMLAFHHINRPVKNDKYLTKIGILGKGRIHPLGIPKAIQSINNLEKRNKIFFKKIMIIKKFFKGSDKIYLPEIFENTKVGGFHYGIPFFLLNNEFLSNLSKNFKIVKYNWPALDSLESYKDFHSFNKMIYSDEIKFDDVFNYNDARENLYFFELNFIKNLSNKKLINYLNKIVN
tara:strand:- start:5075 stop:6184 length:1110 start_codon:yes stop_codon:yes gene_type:complete